MIDSNEPVRVYTSREVAEAMRCSHRTALDYLRRGLLPGRRIGGRWKVLEEDLKAFLRGPHPEKD